MDGDSIVIVCLDISLDLKLETDNPSSGQGALDSENSLVGLFRERFQGMEVTLSKPSTLTLVLTLTYSLEVEYEAVSTAGMSCSLITRLKGAAEASYREEEGGGTRGKEGGVNQTAKRLHAKEFSDEGEPLAFEGNLFLSQFHPHSAMQERLQAMLIILLLILILNSSCRRGYKLCRSSSRLAIC